MKVHCEMHFVNVIYLFTVFSLKSQKSRNSYIAHQTKFLSSENNCAKRLTNVFTRHLIQSK